MARQNELRDRILKATTALVEEKKVVEEVKEETKVEKSIDPSVKEAVGMILKEISTSDWSGTSGAYVEREHLDRQIKDITDRRTPFLDAVSYTQANGKTHEWDMITALGSNDTAVEECGTPVDNEATITRYSAQIKTYATKVKVCDLAQWAASDYTNLMDTHLASGMKKILHDVEKKVYYGNNAGSTPNDISGLYKLITDNAAENIVAGSGGTITTTMIDDSIQKIVDLGGMPTHIFMGAKDMRDFIALYGNKVIYNDPTAGMTVGYNLARYMSYAGPIDIVLDPFLTALNSPNTGSDVFVLSMPEIQIAQSEAMYKLPTYRGLDLAETQSVVWNIALEVKVPMWQSMITDLR